MKRILDPPPLEITVGCACRIKCCDNKEYDATVLSMGKNFLTTALFVCLSFFVPFCIQGNAASVTEAEDEWTSQQERAQSEACSSAREETSGHQEEDPSDHHEEQASE